MTPFKNMIHTNAIIGASSNGPTLVGIIPRINLYIGLIIWERNFGLNFTPNKNNHENITSSMMI